MRYLGLDVHSKATVFCLLDASGQVVERGKVDTSGPTLIHLVTRMLEHDTLLVGQEVGAMSRFVNDAVSTQTTILSFNAQHLRMIASSRKKTDKRDAYWIAKALQTGMTPHPVYVPSGTIRWLRDMLSVRRALLEERKRWLLRAMSYLRAGGFKSPRGCGSVKCLKDIATRDPMGIDEHLGKLLDICENRHRDLREELQRIESQILSRAKELDEVQRLKTIPGVGDWSAIAIYATVGDISRFPSAGKLASYAGLVPSVSQTGLSLKQGGITKEGMSSLRSMLVQAGHALLWRCTSESAAPLRAVAQRVRNNRGRSKVAVVAAARHILKIAFYILRDGTVYDPIRLGSKKGKAPQEVSSAHPLAEALTPTLGSQQEEPSPVPSLKGTIHTSVTIGTKPEDLMTQPTPSAPPDGSTATRPKSSKRPLAASRKPLVEGSTHGTTCPDSRHGHVTGTDFSSPLPDGTMPTGHGSREEDSTHKTNIAASNTRSAKRKGVRVTAP